MTDESTKTETGEATQAGVCGVVMPISAWGDHQAQHWVEVKDIIERAIAEAGMEPRPVWLSADTDIIQGRIVRNLHELPMVVCDVSGLNPNVMFELGMRLTFRKPVIVVCDDATRLPFDTGVIDTLSYPADLHFPKIERFIADLSSRISDLQVAAEKGNFKPYLDTFGAFEIIEPPSDHIPFNIHLSDQLNSIELKLNRLERRASFNDNVTRQISDTLLNGTASRKNALRDAKPQSHNNGTVDSDSTLLNDLIKLNEFHASDANSSGVWSMEREDLLIKLWREGKTATEIAEQLGGLSRNAVIGKAHRLGLKSRPLPDSRVD